MDAKEKLLGNIEERLTVYANWVNQGGGIRSEGAEYLYCDLLNEAFDYELKNMNRIRDNFPAIDLGDEGEGLAVQVTSTGDAGKVKKTLERFYDHNLNVGYSRLIVLIAGKAECKSTKFAHPGLALEIWGTTELIAQLRGLSMKKLKAVDAFLRERVDAPKVKEPVLHLPVPERRNPVGFLGRKAELAWIGEELKKGTKPVIVAGLGGVGKTALAVEFRKGWAGNVYFAVFRDSFTRTLADSVGQAIPVEERKGLNEEQTAELALGYLSRCEAGDLLIVDNAEVTGKKWRDLTADPFYEKLRRLPMNVLMTTRHRDTGGRWLGRLAQEELREIFRRHEVNIPEGEMDRLIDAVDGHTMTVDMIARTIRESWGDVTAEKILTAMADSTLNEADFDEIETDHDPEQRQIYAHLRALFDLGGISEDGKYALRCATLLPQTGMDEALFRHALTEGAAKEIKLLEKKGWVDRKEGKVTIHPVVRLVCRTELKPTDGNCEDFLSGLWNQHDEKQYNATKFRQMAELFENSARLLGEKSDDFAFAAGYFWKLVGEPKRALPLDLWAVVLRELFEPNSNALGAAYNNVGTTFIELGNYQKALDYMLKAMRIIEQKLGAEHPSMATNYNNIGYIYGELGDHQKALEYNLKALKILEAVFPADHADLARGYSHMGTTYNALGDYEKALEYDLKALKIYENIYPGDHPWKASCYNNVSKTYAALCNYRKALEYGLKAKEIFERAMEVAHPILAKTYNNLGSVYGILGNEEKNIEYNLKAMEVFEMALPENHPDRAIGYLNVGHSYNKQGNYEKALEYTMKALRIYERVYGAEHLKLATGYNNMGMICENQGNHEKALEYSLKALGIFERAWGADHPDLATSYNNVSSIYDALGDHQKALEYQLKALGILERVLRADHPELVISYNNVGATYGALGDHQKALVYQLKSLEILRRVLRENNPLLAKAYSEVCATYSALGDQQKVLEYRLESLRILEQVLGVEHPDIANYYSYVGADYFVVDNYEKALEYHWKALAIQEKKCPDNHFWNAICRNNIACSYYELGQLEEAAAHMRRAADAINRSSLSENHPKRVDFNQLAAEMEEELRQVRGGE